MTPTMTIPRLPQEPLLGSLPPFNAQRLGFLCAVARAYPDIARIRLGPVPAVVINDPALIGAILVERGDAFGKAPLLLRATRASIGDNLLTLEGPPHRRHRRLMAPALTPRHIAAYGDTMVALAERRQQGWREGRVIDVVAESGALAMAIATATLFDTDLAADADVLGGAIAQIMAYIEHVTSHPFALPLSWPTPRNRRWRATIAQVEDRIRAMIAARRADGDLAARDDLLSALIRARDTEEGAAALSDRELCSEALTLFVAGHETTAKTLAWALYELGRHPAAYDGVRAELATVLGGRRPTVADLGRLPYLACVVKETLRLYPPGYFLGRYTLQDVRIGPYVLPRGTLAILSAYTLHRRPDYYPDPRAFRPERFAGDQEKRLPRFAYLPFGAGAHVCIGNHFALMEAQLVLAAWLQARDLRLVSTRPVRPVPAFVLAPGGPITLRVGSPLSSRHEDGRATLSGRTVS